jgi:signal peptidase II
MRRFIFAFALAALTVVVDRVSKLFFLSNPAETFGSDFLFGIVSFHLTLNPGIAFGLPLPRIIILFISAVVIIAMIFYMMRTRLFVTTLGSALIVFGAASNFFDRIFYHEVIDYIDVRWFTVLNLADVIISIGAIVIIISEVIKKDDTGQVE